MVERILALIKQKGLSVSAVEKQLGFGNGAIKRFSTNSPSIDKIIALSNFLNVSVEFILFGKETMESLPEDVNQLIRYYHSLDDMGRGMVLGKAETLAELAAERAAEQTQKAKGIAPSSANPRRVRRKPLPFPTEPEQTEEDNCYIDVCSFPANAGTGVYFEDIGIKPLQIVHTDIADRANYAIRVSGDSMMPEYCDGDIVLVETCRSIEIGEIGVFMVDGDAYIKKYGGDRLISLNPKYKDMLLKKYESSFCRGRVLGIAKVVE